MGSFEANRAFEKEVEKALLPALQAAFRDRGLLLTKTPEISSAATRGRDIEVQRACGDMSVNRAADGSFVEYLDLKAERTTYPNLFFETWSNFCADPQYARLGWGLTSRTDKLMYFFADTGVLAFVRMPELRSWLDEDVVDGWGRQSRRLYALKERPQMKHAQRNLTIGRLAPFAEIPAAAFAEYARLEGGALRFVDRLEFLSVVDPAAARGAPAEPEVIGQAGWQPPPFARRPGRTAGARTAARG